METHYLASSHMPLSNTEMKNERKNEISGEMLECFEMINYGDDILDTAPFLQLREYMCWKNVVHLSSVVGWMSRPTEGT